MTALVDIKPSISKLPRDLGMALILDVRKRRRVYRKDKREKIKATKLNKAIEKLSVNQLEQLQLVLKERAVNETK